jgi:hypothetical protein
MFGLEHQTSPFTMTGFDHEKAFLEFLSLILNTSKQFLSVADSRYDIPE